MLIDLPNRFNRQPRIQSYIKANTLIKRGRKMFIPGTLIKMTKGYRGIEGVVTEKTESRFELYIMKLNNGLNVIAGPSAFIPLEKEGELRVDSGMNERKSDG
jgi:hypothetical protein